jgi:hypothetical protein
MLSTNNSNTLYLGTFNSEFFWKDKQFSELPSIPDQQSDKVLSVIDELQFVFCKNSNDTVITRLPFNRFHKDYLFELGFEFKNNDIPLDYGFSEKDPYSKSVCNLVAEHKDLEYFRNMISGVNHYSPYSILLESDMLLKKLNLETEIPDINAVKKVNSKVFSTKLSKQLKTGKKEEIIYSSNDLFLIGKEMLAQSPVLIKDPMGVSGKGNLLIQSEKLLNRICDHIRKQEYSGKSTCFIIESLLNKKMDFSCQLYISQLGEIKFVTIQVMQNKAFAFSGIQTAESEFYSFLDKTDYLKQAEWIGKEMWKEGYFGPVCIDSMVDQQDQVIPIIEINARKSMGLINFHLDQYLSGFGRKGKLMYLSLIMKNELPFEYFLKKLHESDILFSKNNPQGILPLSANTLNINTKHTNAETESQSSKARFYFSIVTQKDEPEKDTVLPKLNCILNDLNIKVVN